MEDISKKLESQNQKTEPLLDENQKLKEANLSLIQQSNEMDIEILKLNKQLEILNNRQSRLLDFIKITPVIRIKKDIDINYIIHPPYIQPKKPADFYKYKKEKLEDYASLGNLKAVCSVVSDSKNSKQKDSALVFATTNGHEDVVKFLINNGANVNTLIYGNQSILMIACQKGYFGIVKYLIRFKAMINLKDNTGYTALMIACVIGNLDIIKILIENGADKYIKNNNNKTAYDLVCQQDFNDDDLKILIKKILK